MSTQRSIETRHKRERPKHGRPTLRPSHHASKTSRKLPVLAKNRKVALLSRERWSKLGMTIAGVTGFTLAMVVGVGELAAAYAKSRIPRK